VSEHITHVAFDLRRDSVTAAWLLPSETSPAVRRIPYEVEPFRRLVRAILAHGPARACYEANPLGYAPQRQLTAWAQPREVIAPSLTLGAPATEASRTRGTPGNSLACAAWGKPRASASLRRPSWPPESWSALGRRAWVRPTISIAKMVFS